MISIFTRPHHEVGALLASGAPVFVSVNPVEYHGPHLSLHNDALISAGLIADLHAKLAVRHPEWPLLVGHDVQVGVDPTVGAGSRVTPYRTVRRLVCELADSLAALGATKVVLMTFHGSPMHSCALQAGADRLRARGIPCYCPMNSLLHEQLTVSPDTLAPMVAHIADPAERAAVLAALPTDFHAGFLETSLTLHYAPDSVSARLAAVPPAPPFAPNPLLSRASRLFRRLGASALADELVLAAGGVGWMGLDPFPGYTATPHHASAPAGAFLAERMVARFAEEAEAVFAGAPGARPVLSWLPWLTLGGYLSAPAPAAAPLSL